MGNRGRLNIRAISDTDRRLHAGLLNSAPASVRAVAVSVGSHPLVLDGVLVRVLFTGTFAMWRGLTLEQVDQRKAAAACEAMGIE